MGLEPMAYQVLSCAHGHIHKLCMYHKVKQQFRRLGMLPTAIIPRATYGPAHNNGCNS